VHKWTGQLTVIYPNLGRFVLLLSLSSKQQHGRIPVLHEQDAVFNHHPLERRHVEYEHVSAKKNRVQD
jgi:hypothetical protein